MGPLPPGGDVSIRVFVVDDQELVRAGFVVLLESEEEIEVVGQAGDGAEAVELVAETEPDVVLMDIRMPVMDGIEATRRIRSADDAPEVLILTTFDTDEYAFDALEAGAGGFLVKDTPPAELLAAVKAAAGGGAVISPGTTRRLLGHIIAARPGRKRARPETLEVLTARELEVFELVARGLRNAEIAEQLYISELTAKTHVSRILTKLNLPGRVHAVVLAYETGLVIPGMG